MSTTVKALPIRAANVSDGQFDTDTESDDKIISKVEEEILEECSGEGGNVSEIMIIEDECDLIREIEFNLQINHDWTIPVVSQFREKKPS